MFSSFLFSTEELTGALYTAQEAVKSSRTTFDIIGVYCTALRGYMEQFRFIHNKDSLRASARLL
tara:strand:+ start:280 stop:471 length:192 start_codon:yes stop_codon:yes gene_type:complete